MSIQRYMCVEVDDISCCVMEPHDRGNFVRYADVAALQAERDELRKRLEQASQCEVPAGWAEISAQCVSALEHAAMQVPDDYVAVGLQQAARRMSAMIAASPVPPAPAEAARDASKMTEPPAWVDEAGMYAAKRIMAELQHREFVGGNQQREAAIHCAIVDAVQAHMPADAAQQADSVPVPRRFVDLVADTHMPSDRDEGGHYCPICESWSAGDTDRLEHADDCPVIVAQRLLAGGDA